ncbi:MAG: hypothetical protein K6E84_06855 [Lachnospiraceae bacterium]|nr:hypothetical protein [Lachnospiraceae bacterium]
MDLKSIFKSNQEKILDELIGKVQMNMSNNYKDNAQAGFAEFEKKLEEYISAGSLKGKSAEKYQVLRGEYAEKLKGYTHKDQKPYWH